MAYFKQNLREDTPVIVRIMDRFQNKEGKYGTVFPYKIEVNGVSYDHDASMTEEKALQKFSIGQYAQATLKKNNYNTLSIYWSEAPRGVDVPNQDPVPLKPAPVKPEVDWDAIADSKILFGFMVAFIEQGKDENQAYAKGMAAFRLHKKGETELRTGVPAIPSHPKELVDEVNSAFSDDPTVPHAV